MSNVRQPYATAASPKKGRPKTKRGAPVPFAKVQHPIWDRDDAGLEAHSEAMNNDEFPIYAQVALFTVDDKLDWAFALASSWFGEGWRDHIWEVYDRIEKEIAFGERIERMRERGKGPVDRAIKASKKARASDSRARG